MKKPLVVGILRETKSNVERRAPLTPADVKWLVERGVKIEVESSPLRIFSDDKYKKAGAKIVSNLQKATLAVGIKEPLQGSLKEDIAYMIFSHTVKGQKHNMLLLQEFLNKKITLVDYEKIVNTHGKRLVFFGRFAGICGTVDSLYYFGKKLKAQGIKTPFLALKPAYQYSSLRDLQKSLEKVGMTLKKKGLDKRICPFIIGIIGHGNVSKGVQEVLDALDADEIHPKDIKYFFKHKKHLSNKIYKIVFLREEKLRRKSKKGFYFEEYKEHPTRFESNLDKYLPYLKMLIHTSYWQESYPRMVPKKMLKKLSKRKRFDLGFIADISCDVEGSIEATYKVASSGDGGIYTYNALNDEYADGFLGEGITLLAVENLPTELPRDSSRSFSGLIKEYVYQVAVHGAVDIKNHIPIPKEIRKAVLTQSGKLTKDYKYLKKYLKR